ncbi:histidine phosphatase family protein [Cylindrospermopsis raciborskii S07]|uniref:histidine phosphatase family protein n=1 Tax=Cylindrospermopsis raciborskii TaxID=77022 RepID=UPI000C9E58EF|nr:histidine phosphatase family protein [Cylindrospermopsis raciborskii]PNK02876.1 histidine phosphatase family protein [Cylindrospermopsis raciborskii S07]PNK05595.1 histidine phosphatase family protein [Cylindrospermopsis raciborskii S10]PNK07987.1 histidine phosphatase family protein [Cylindrospermopsis raciborskii S14]PNK15633.1 histidine phosphatase family protein [Cylindrospermopsis raciborskii S06]PNK18134.1 histidine phosphatase family protein [Cylindrospermopsis raciborskii S05]
MSQVIWIARHANRLDFVNPDWFLTAERRYDPPLSDDGIIQAQQLAKRLKGERIKHIFASPFLRTVQTANAVAEILDLDIKLETGLSEWLNPEWMTEEPEKLSTLELVKLFPRIDRSYTPRIAAKYPETHEQVRYRSGQTARCLAAEFWPHDILLVAHGASVLGAAMGFVGDLAKTEVKAKLCSLVKLVHQESQWFLELKGDTSHLEEIPGLQPEYSSLWQLPPTTPVA